MSTNEQGPQSRTDLQSSQCNGAQNRPAYTIGDGIRMLGHLLEHHQTEGCLARTKSGNPIGHMESNASCFCYVGGLWRTAQELGVNEDDMFDVAAELTGLHSGHQWDKLDEDSRKFVINQMKNFQG